MNKLRKIPLNAVRAFEVAARHQSFSRAADELGVTHGAISKQIRQLEELIGKALFHRTGRGVTLTEHGSLLAIDVSKSLNQLAEAFEGYLGNGERLRKIRITTVPSFAAAFLAPRLAKFHHANPDIRLSIDTTSRLVDFSMEPIDAGIRFGAGKWAGLKATPISSKILTPVCAPVFYKNIQSKPAAEVIRKSLLLHNLSKRDWQAWMNQAGIGKTDPKREYIFEDTNVILQAALEGQGLALLPKILVLGALKSGRLVQAFEQEIEGRFGYWFVAPEKTLKSPDLKAFADWLEKEARKAEAR